MGVLRVLRSMELLSTTTSCAGKLGKTGPMCGGGGCGGVALFTSSKTLMSGGKFNRLEKLRRELFTFKLSEMTLTEWVYAATFRFL